MPLTAADLTYDVGELMPEWFPGENLSDNLTTWLTQGYAVATGNAIVDTGDRDGIAEAYGYVRGYTAISLRIAGTADTVSLEGLSRTLSTGRAAFFRDKAEEWQNKLDTRLNEALSALVALVPSPPLSSYSVTNRILF